MIYPAEVCEVARGQLFKKRIPEELYGKQALDFATMKPSVRMDLIRRGVAGRVGNAPATTNGLDGGRLEAPVRRSSNFGETSTDRDDFQIQEHSTSEAVMDSGMDISQSLVMVNGRVLETPRMLFGKNSNVVCVVWFGYPKQILTHYCDSNRDLARGIWFINNSRSPNP